MGCTAPVEVLRTVLYIEDAAQFGGPQMICE